MAGSFWDCCHGHEPLWEAFCLLPDDSVGGALTSPTATPTARLMWVFLSFLPHLLYHLTLAAWEHFPNTLPRPGPSMTLLSTDSKSRSFVETILGNKQRKRLSFLPEPLQSREDQ